MLVSYNWLKSYIPECIEAEKLADVFTFHICEVEEVIKKDDDYIFDLKILPDRAGDLLSHIGVARELAGVLGINFVSPESKYIVPNSISTNLSIDIQTTKVKRYMGRIVRNVIVGPSPSWVSKMLESIGQRSINNIVDATNLVMFNSGHPVHAFDLNKLAASKITVKESSNDFEFPLVGSDNIVAKIKKGDLLICSEDTPIALAGIKGGVDSGMSVSNSYTTDILLEVANFDGSSIRKTGQRLGILSDARKRFENNVPFALSPFAMQELSALIFEMCPNAIFEEVIDVVKEPAENRSVTFSVQEINKYLGTKLEPVDITHIFTKYNYSFSQENDVFILTVPYYRQDIVGVHNIASEIGRIYGYENITPILPHLVNSENTDDTLWADMVYAKQQLVSLGYQEVINYTFVKKGDYQVARGVKGKDFLRTNLKDGFMHCLEINRLNAPVLEIQDVKIFEIGTVFLKDKEVMHVIFGDKKNITEIPLSEYVKTINNSFIEEGEFSVLFKNPAQFLNWSAYPFIVRDVSFWVPQSMCLEDKNLLEKIKLYTKNYKVVLSSNIIDKFTKDDLVSTTIRIVFQSKDKTLQDSDINPIFNSIIENVKIIYNNQITVR
jgi:phenylalanyl-tRNA synthetase beta subunit